MVPVTALEAPRRVLMGRARHRLMMTRVICAWWPIPAAVIVVLAMSPMTRLGVLLCIVAAELRWPGVARYRLRAAWYRSRWWFDARAAGLAVVADPGLNATAEGGRPKGVELVPRLLGIRCQRTSRVYKVKALPGQRLETFERAIPDLVFRFGADVAVIQHPTRRRVLFLEVVSAHALAEPLRHPGR